MYHRRHLLMSVAISLGILPLAAAEATGFTPAASGSAGDPPSVEPRSLNKLQDGGAGLDGQSKLIPLDAAHWDAQGKATFEHPEGFPAGRLILGEGLVAAKGIVFSNGTIEYDAKLQSDGFAAIRFRVQEPQSAEIFYLRPDADCPAADDCFQYVPRVHGVWPWEMYPEYQGHAPVVIGAWNHVKLVVAGKRMSVFINNAPTPTLVVPELQGDIMSGALELAGPGAFANLTITPEAPSEAAPAEGPGRLDARLIRTWHVSPPADLAYGVTPRLSDMPADPSAWKPVAAEHHGLVNLSRLYGAPTLDQSIGSFAWLTTSLQSNSDQTKRVSFGFLHEAWVFVNGKLVFTGENLYYPDAKRLSPDGRLSLDNSSFELPLHKGRNDIVVALNNILGIGHMHYGWGLEMRLDNLEGLQGLSE
jgi:hypothetical protein